VLSQESLNPFMSPVRTTAGPLKGDVPPIFAARGSHQNEVEEQLLEGFPVETYLLTRRRALSLVDALP
jgi:hypothetical protein